jgi:hypothetical protein
MWSVIFAHRFRKTVLLAGALVTLGSYSQAGTITIVSVTDLAVPVNRSDLFVGGANSNVVAASWTQAASFSDVTIDASLATDLATFQTGTAYLMSAIGPGTTPASEVVAPAGFAAPFVAQPNGPVPLTVLFSGLSLGPGTYYLVLSAPFGNQIPAQSPLFWQIPTDPVITTAASVNPFPPASSFLFPTSMLMFDVTSVPEPRTGLGTFFFLCALILYFGRRERFMGRISSRLETQRQKKHKLHSC